MYPVIERSIRDEMNNLHPERLSLKEEDFLEFEKAWRGIWLGLALGEDEDESGNLVRHYQIFQSTYEAQ